MTGTLKKLKIVIIVLSILLAISLIALALLYIWRRPQSPSGSAVVPNNYIDHRENGSSSLPSTDETQMDRQEATITIHKNHAADSDAFACENMLPGDKESRTYLVEVSHTGTLTLHFRANIREGGEKLAEVLWCTVAVPGEEQPLYDGRMREMPQSIHRQITAESGHPTRINYDITVYLNTDVGNEYMQQGLWADFCWWVEERGGDPLPSQPTDVTDPTRDDGELTPPLADSVLHFCIWVLIAVISLLLNILLLLLLLCKRGGNREKGGTDAV